MNDERVSASINNNSNKISFSRSRPDAQLHSKICTYNMYMYVCMYVIRIRFYVYMYVHTYL